jgi:hypothetical protein
VARLYEQDAPPEEIRRRIGQHVWRWKGWVLSDVRNVTVIWAFPMTNPLGYTLLHHQHEPHPNPYIMDDRNKPLGLPRRGRRPGEGSSVNSALSLRPLGGADERPYRHCDVAVRVVV